MSSRARGWRWYWVASGHGVILGAAGREAKGRRDAAGGGRGVAIVREGQEESVGAFYVCAFWMRREGLASLTVG